MSLSIIISIKHTWPEIHPKRFSFYLSSFPISVYLSIHLYFNLCLYLFPATIRKKVHEISSIDRNWFFLIKIELAATSNVKSILKPSTLMSFSELICCCCPCCVFCFRLTINLKSIALWEFHSIFDVQYIHM